MAPSSHLLRDSSSESLSAVLLAVVRMSLDLVELEDDVFEADFDADGLDEDSDEEDF